jgi:hypothetical protein
LEARSATRTPPHTSHIHRPPHPQGFVNSIVLLLYQKLEGRMQQLWDVVLQQPIAANGEQLNGAAGQQQLLQQLQQQQAAGGGGAAAPAGAGVAEPGSFAGTRSLAAGGDGSQVAGGEGSSSVSKKLFAKRSCTEAMLKVLQHEIRKTHARTQNIE